MTREEYEAINAVNWSTLKHLGKSPAHYLEAIKNRSGDSDARRRGRITHVAVFEPERLARDVVVYPDVRNGKKWDAFTEKHMGKEIVTPRMWEVANTIAMAARSNPVAAKYLAGGKAEHAVEWTFEPPPLEHFERWSMACKGRLDFVADCGAIVDLKSTKDASPSGFGREVMRYEYHAQAAFYVDGYAAATGRELPFIFIAVEASAPHVVQTYRVTEEQLDLGRERYRDLLALLNVCRQSANWPGYAETEMELTLPAWALPDEDDGVDPDLVFAEQ